MSYLMVPIVVGFLFGLAVVASNPSPYFAALGLVVAAGTGCVMVMANGATFMGLVLFLIYLGGMLVVFAYTSALASEPYPETLGSQPVALNLLMLSGGVMMGGWLWVKEWDGLWLKDGSEDDNLMLCREDMHGVALMYGVGGAMMVIGAWVLLLTLFVVLEVVRGGDRGALRVV